MRPWLALLALGAPVLLSRPVAARPADCLVVMEGRAYIDGPCEFTPAAGGDFTITLGVRSAQVMVDPGSREGRAFYQDSSPADPQAWAIGDVTRNGACWGNRAGRVCAWEPGQRPRNRSEAPRTMPGILLAQAGVADANLVRQWERRAGDWTITRYQDGRTRRLARCEMERSFPDGSLLRITAILGMGLRIGFASGNDALDRLGASFPIRYWVDDESAARALTATIGPPGFARFSEADGEPGSEDALANGRVFFIRAGNTLLRFPLDRSNAAFRQLFVCANS